MNSFIVGFSQATGSDLWNYSYLYELFGNDFNELFNIVNSISYMTAHNYGYFHTRDEKRQFRITNSNKKISIFFKDMHQIFSQHCFLKQYYAIMFNFFANILMLSLKVIRIEVVFGDGVSYVSSSRKHNPSHKKYQLFTKKECMLDETKIIKDINEASYRKIFDSFLECAYPGENNLINVDKMYEASEEKIYICINAVRKCVSARDERKYVLTPDEKKRFHHVVHDFSCADFGFVGLSISFTLFLIYLCVCVSKQCEDAFGISIYCEISGETDPIVFFSDYSMNDCYIIFKHSLAKKISSSMNKIPSSTSDGILLSN